MLSTSPANNTCPALEGAVVKMIVEAAPRKGENSPRTLSIWASGDKGVMPHLGHLFSAKAPFGDGEYYQSASSLPGRSVDPGYVVGSEVVSVISTSSPSRGIPVRGEPGCFSVIITGKTDKGTYVLEYYGSDETEIGAIEWMKPPI